MSTAVHYALSDFVTGAPIIDVPIMKGASWANPLNAPDTLECQIDMRDPAALALDLFASTEPKKTILSARTDDDVVLAWGVIGKRTWVETGKRLKLNASGFWQYLNGCLIGPPSARTAQLVNVDGSPNTALDTIIAGVSLGTLGKKLVEQRLTWPGSPSMVFPPDEAGTRTDTYPFVNFKKVGAALSDLVKRENGPDFAFDAYRGSNGLNLEYQMRHGSEAQPRIGTDAGVWSLGQGSPLVGFELDDDGVDFATASWMSAGRQASSLLTSRMLNDGLVVGSGYPPMDYVDTSHGDVVVQATLDQYNRENMEYASGPVRVPTFSVRGDASPGIGQVRPGDTIRIDVYDGHPYIKVPELRIRILSLSGDETGKLVKVESVLTNG